MTDGHKSATEFESGLLPRRIRIRVSLFALLGPPLLAVAPVAGGACVRWLGAVWAGRSAGLDDLLGIALASLIFGFWAIVLTSIPSLVFIWSLTSLALELARNAHGCSVVVLLVSGVGAIMGLALGVVLGAGVPDGLALFCGLGLFAGMSGGALLIAILRDHLDLVRRTRLNESTV